MSVSVSNVRPEWATCIQPRLSEQPLSRSMHLDLIIRLQNTDQATRPKCQAHPVNGALGARDLD